MVNYIMKNNTLISVLINFNYDAKVMKNQSTAKQDKKKKNCKKLGWRFISALRRPEI